jgi:peptide/nickel transport system substrate-binding protein
MLSRRTLLAASAGTLALPAIAQRSGGDVIVAQQAQPPTLDAQTTTAQAARNITLHAVETLFARDEAGNPQPDLAEGVDISADGLTYRFTLRGGISFHNGQALTSADVKASLERYGKVGGSAFIMQPVAAIETPDARTVVVKLQNVYPGFIEGISSPRAPCAILPASEAAKPAGQAQLIGTGPYRFVEYRPDSHAKLARYDGYASNGAYRERDGFAGRKTPYFDSVTFRFVPVGGARTAGLETGEIHVLEAMAVPAAQRLKGNAGIRTYEMLPWAYQTLMMNNAWGLTANVQVRRAIQSALDLEEIMAISADGLYRMQPAWQHPGTQHFPGVEGLAPYAKQDQDKARSLLREAGYRGEELIIVADNAFKNHLDAATIASEQLRAVGMTAKLEVMDWPTVLARRTRPDNWNLWPLMMGIEPYEGPYGVVGFFAGEKPVQIKPDPVIEEAQAKLTSSLSLEDRVAAVKAFQDRVYAEAISIKVGAVGIVQATTARVANYKPYRIPRMWDCWFA